MRVYQHILKGGITRTKEFEKKMLASFAVNVGTKCGHGCCYCSTGAILRMHPSFKAAGESPFGHGYAIVDPHVPDRVARDARRIKQRGLVQLCTVVDAWAPEAQHYQLGRRCLEAILAEPGWSVRILTKNASVRKDFDLIERYRDRVLVGLSITATPDKESIVRIIEPNASPIQDRMAVMSDACSKGLRTFAMLCPLLPGVADSARQIDRLVEIAVSWGVEEIFVEAVNQRGAGLKNCQTALEENGFQEEAAALCSIRRKANWSSYVVQLVANVQQSVRKHHDIKRLRFLLYPKRLLAEHVDQIRSDDEGVIWL